MDQMEAVYATMRVWQDTVQTQDEGAWIMSSTKPVGDGQVSCPEISLSMG
jgi:hypothetical protein